MLTKKEINELFDKGMSEKEILETISKTCKEVTKERRESTKKKDEKITVLKERLIADFLGIYEICGIKNFDPKDVERSVDDLFKEFELIAKFF